MTGQFVKVEPGGTVFRGLAVPFDSPAYLVEADGRLVGIVSARDLLGAYVASDTSLETRTSAELEEA